MQRNLFLRHGLWVSLIAGGTVGCLLSDAEGLHFTGRAASVAVMERFPDASAFQSAALPFADPSAFRTAALRLPETSAFQSAPPRSANLSRWRKPTLGSGATSSIEITRSTAAVEHASPRVRLIGFQVAAALPPMGHTRFCLRYPYDCKVQAVDFRRRNLKLTSERWNELMTINRDVNKSIAPAVAVGNETDWIIYPLTGDCKNYAITKRHLLLAQGWPSRSLLLAEVKLPSGEHHLVLVVRVKGGDLVLDNLTNGIRLVASTYDQYGWVRIQSPKNPKLWESVLKANTVRTAMRLD